MKRSELYEKIWVTPISRLSEDLNLSNVGLAKICRRHSIPVPPRGYWAKLNAGQTPKRITLPKKDRDEEIHFPTHPAPRAAGAAQDQTKKWLEQAAATPRPSTEPAVMPNDLTKPHPLIAATAQYCQQLPALIAKYERLAPQHRWNSNVKRPPEQKHGLINYHEAEGLDVNAAFDDMNWVLRFHHGIFSALKLHGVTIRRERRDRPGLPVVVAALKGEEIFISFSQGYSRKQIEISEYIKTKKESPFASQYQYAAADRMNFSVRGTEHGIGRTWTASRRILEGQLSDIVNSCLSFFVAQPIARCEHQESARQAQIRAERAERTRRRSSAQRDQINVALKAVDAFRAHEALERFFDQVEAQLDKLNERDRMRAETWLSIVRIQCQQTNPVDALLSAVTSGNWTYREPDWWPSPESEETNQSGLDGATLLTPLYR